MISCRSKVLFLLFFLLIATLSGQNLSKLELTILHTNDNHGRLLPFDIVGQEKIGGMAPRMTLIKEIREEIAKKQGHLLLLDCGDINTGEPTSDMLKAEPDVLLMNKMGYHAMAAGNHEFDLNMADLLAQSKKAQFPYLSANVFYSKTGEPVFSTMIVVNLGEMRIGIFGITPEDTPYISTCGKNPELFFAKPEKVIPDILKKLEEKSDFIIALIHTDHEEAIRLAQLFPKIDIILGGHTHLPMLAPLQIGKTLVSQAGCYGMMVGRFDLAFEDRKLKDWKYQMIGINLTKPVLDGDLKIGCLPFEKQFAPDPEVVEFLKPYLSQTEELLSKPIGNASENIERNPNSNNPYSSSMGNFICDTIRKETNVDIALQNVGGMRSDILKGKITPRDVLQVLPFANTIFIYDLTGKEVRQIFEHMCSGHIGPKGMLEASGLEVQIQENKLTSITIEGKPLEEGKIYRVAINSFIAKGGDGYDIFTKFSSFVDSGLLISNIVQKYIQSHSPISPNKEKRVVWQVSK